MSPDIHRKIFKQLFSFIGACLITCPTLLLGQEEKPFDTALILPLQTIGINQETPAALSNNKKSLMKVLADEWFGSNQIPLTAYLKKTKPQAVMTERNKSITDKIMVKSNADNSNVFMIQPIWCSVMDHDLFFLIASHPQTNILFASDHLAIKRQDSTAYADLSAHYLRLSQNLKTKVAAPRPPSESALKIGLSLAMETTRLDEGSSQCLNLLWEEQLLAALPSTPIVRFLGSEVPSLITALSGDAQPKLARASRQLLMNWRDSAPNLPRTLPFKFPLSAKLVDTVFGKHLPWNLSEPITVSVTANGKLNLTSIKPLIDKLRAERASLLLAEKPQIAKINRAWVYLDRGRAWGLQMNDRLVTLDSSGTPIKGHVVQFFGPEANIVSPRGFPIMEGAIVYIRKNQKLTKIGQEFSFDEKTFPAPYPPK